MDEEFEQHRRYLFGIAYRMLSSVSDAEDIVQDTYLRYAATPRESIHRLRPFLTTIVTRLCLNQLQSARARRETYVGPWLPEPLRTDSTVSPGSFNHVAEEGWDEDSISMAFLVLLERLTPLARAVFLLREVFDYDYAEIAQIVERDEAACRQIFSRARKELARDERRFKPSPETHQRILHSFVHAVTDGDMQELMDVLTDDVVLWADGAGRIRGAATRPLYGRDAAAAFLVSSRRLAPEGTLTFELATINAEPGLIMRAAGQPFLVINADTDGERISALRLIANPDKLSAIDR